MRVLFLENHPMLVNGLPNGFRSAGCEVMVSGHFTAENLPAMLESYRPDLVFTLGWSGENSLYRADMIRRTVKAAHRPLVYWATEDPTHTHSFSLPLIQKLQPDYVFTICRKRVDYYKSLGIKAAHADFGYSPSVFYRTEPDKNMRCSVAVVANGYPTILKKYPRHYRIQSFQTLVAPLIRAGIRVDFWGKKWEDTESVLGCRIPEDWLHGYLPYPQTNAVYNSADVHLGLQNQLEQVTQRTYEILGSGGFLITSDTPEIRRLFKPGEDLAVSSSPEQTLELVEFYLNNPEKRSAIRKQGQKTVTEHNYVHRAKYMMDILRLEHIIPPETV